jgi:triacylglycerol lipase
MPFPIVLAHGIARFDILHEKLRELHLLPAIADDDALHYFRNIKTFLESHGFVVFHSNVSFAGSVEQRKIQLAQQIEEIVGQGHPKVHLIGHSMGGLDARHMIVDVPTMADKVASLTTIGTPHLGTPFADWGLAHGGHETIEALKPLNLDGFADLSTAACTAFNQRATDSEAQNSVSYHTYSSHDDQVLRVFLPLQASWAIIRGEERRTGGAGENDGLVPVRSQKWRPQLAASNGVTKPVTPHDFPLPADHLNQVGWWHPNKVLGFPAFPNPAAYEAKIKDVYLEIATRVSTLRARL